MKKYLKLFERLRAAIISGGYVFGSRLPSKRAMANETGNSIVTVEHAYGLLCDEGYACARERSGFFVAYRAEGFAEPARMAKSTVVRVNADHHRVPGNFPFTVMARTVRGVMARYGERLFVKSPNMGLVELRSAVASYLARRKNLQIDPSQIVIGSGAEYLYGLLAQMFRDKTIGVEDPAYAKICEVYTAHGVNTLSLKLGERGILDEELERSGFAILHVTPYRSYPTGVSADASKRHAYVRWAHRRDGILIEDDFESEFARAPSGAETLFALDGGRRVIYLNTFSKTIAPSLRIGYMVLPKELLTLYARKVGFYSCTVPVFDQLFLADLIDSGDFERHLNRLRRRLETIRSSPRLTNIHTP